MQPWICESSRKTSLIFQINRLMARKATKVIRLCVMLQGGQDSFLFHIPLG